METKELLFGSIGTSTMIAIDTVVYGIKVLQNFVIVATISKKGFQTDPTTRRLAAVFRLLCAASS